MSYPPLDDSGATVQALRGPAPAVASVALAALADDLALQPREWFLDLLHRLVAGDGTDHESARRGLDLPTICEGIAAQGIWLLHQEVMANRSLPAAGTAFEILTVIEPDRARLQALRELAADWLPECCRTGQCDDEPTASDGDLTGDHADELR
ncbi:hypothetical protein ACIGXI_37650 [Kitasatospora aureofaciens]|uniref:hypothetical protein n=1 Tax=Kitasatospora aureofaciens TaxID=1894 RepID=UPI0037CA4A8B